MRNKLELMEGTERRKQDTEEFFKECLKYDLKGCIRVRATLASIILTNLGFENAASIEMPFKMVYDNEGLSFKCYFDDQGIFNRFSEEMPSGLTIGGPGEYDIGGCVQSDLDDFPYCFQHQVVRFNYLGPPFGKLLGFENISFDEVCMDKDGHFMDTGKIGPFLVVKLLLITLEEAVLAVMRKKDNVIFESSSRLTDKGQIALTLKRRETSSFLSIFRTEVTETHIGQQAINKLVGHEDRGTVENLFELHKHMLNTQAPRKNTQAPRQNTQAPR